MAISSFSRFVDTEQIIVSGKETFGLWHVPNFINRDFLSDSQVGSLNIKADLAGRPDLISNKLYGTPYLFWVIIMFNKPQNPLNWPQSGSVIRFPVKSIVLANT